ncbi:DEAD/DEAH box helicase [Oligoflexus sp.]|uniref:DEAD/DEAH box helicase n=1 Tax=Oligoflexus sp. TaxID=1971216 RepID=UPI002D7762D4|nr:AAA domain-containing protein [Oligoflexus sp.]
MVAYHQREMRREWWAYFARLEMESEQLFEDQDCIAGLIHDGRAPEKVARSFLYTCIYDPVQEVKAQVNDAFSMKHDPGVTATITELDRELGLIRFKTTAKDLPATLDLVPKKPRGYDFEKVVREYAEAYVNGHIHQALDDFLERRPPRLNDSTHLPQSEAETSVEKVVKVICAMEGSSLVIQGPPGAGKTYVGAQAISELCKHGKRVGIMSNSHKAIDNLLIEAIQFCHAESKGKRVIKIGQSVSIEAVELVESGSQLTNFDSVMLVGGTVWAFAKTHFKDQFDFLFIDEASQVSLANLVAASGAARNFVFLGDQMQLAQPAKGSHPGDSGLSCLDYYLMNLPTIPANQGIFLPVTRRLHPDICEAISDGIYEGRLTHHPSTENRVLLPKGTEIHVRMPSGICYVPIIHEGNRQSSEEEAIAVREIVAELLQMKVCEGAVQRPLIRDDILIVAPYNLQVRNLQRVLGDNLRIGSVDKFQGQEAAVVILSLGASTASDAPRGIDFIFDLHRMNVALSRAKSLAIVVSNAGLASCYVSDPNQMRLVNFYCRVVAKILPGNHSLDETDASIAPIQKS